MSRTTMRGKPGQQLSIYCMFPDHIQPTLTGHFQFKVQNYVIVYQRILETAHLSKVSGGAVEKICEVSSSALQLVLLTTHGTANETICEVRSRAVAQ